MRYEEYLYFARDIFDSISEIEGFISGMGHADFVKDKKTINAVIRSLEVISKAAKRIPDRVKKKYLGVSWKEIEDREDTLIHKYFEVDAETVWNIATGEIPVFRLVIEKIIDEEE